jgi:hypothetical protein
MFRVIHSKNAQSEVLCRTFNCHLLVAILKDIADEGGIEFRVHREDVEKSHFTPLELYASLGRPLARI